MKLSEVVKSMPRTSKVFLYNWNLKKYELYGTAYLIVKKLARKITGDKKISFIHYVDNCAFMRVGGFNEN